MRSWPSNARTLTTGAVAIAGVAYPFAVYFNRDRLPATVFVAAALLLMGIQLTVFRSPLAKLWRVPLLISAIMTIVIALLDQNVAREVYPVVRSLAVSAIFCWTLISPPSLVERFARIRQPNLPDAVIRYCRNVSIIWAIWLAINAVVAMSLVVWGDLRSWAVWTGGVSYAISGLIFAGEFGFRFLILERQKRP